MSSLGLKPGTHVTREWNLQAILLFARISRANWRLLPAPRLARIVLSNACHCFRRSLLHDLSTNRELRDDRRHAYRGAGRDRRLNRLALRAAFRQPKRL